MGNYKFDYTPFLKEGKEKELEFATDVAEIYGGNLWPGTKYDDIYRHIDVFWEWDMSGKTASFDVKGLKKSKRSDNNVDPDIEWVELQNVNGNPGWLYGEEDYVAFEGLKDWIIIRRTGLIDIIDNNVKDKTIYNTNDGFLKYYQRSGRKDIIVKVPTKLIREKANMILKKREALT